MLYSLGWKKKIYLIDTAYFEKLLFTLETDKYMIILEISLYHNKYNNIKGRRTTNKKKQRPRNNKGPVIPNALQLSKSFS